MATNLSEIIKDMQEAGLDPVRSAQSYSFGTEEECRKLFVEAFLLVDKTVKDFKWIPEYDEIVSWLTNTEGKGLALFGSVGRGKTVILTGILPLLFKMAGKSLKQIHAINLRKDPKYIDRWAYAIDDVGTEPMVNDFGTKYEPFDEILNLAEAKIKPLFFSTNMNSYEFTDRYGLRGWDRVQRLCKCVIFVGGSFRE